METRELRKLRRSLDKFIGNFDDCIKTGPSRRHLRTYINGQLGPLERKSIEPMALEAEVPPRTLQEFMSIHRWDEAKVGSRLRKLVKRDHADENAIAVIDETSFAKKGDKTAGVQRQHCGATGKTENCTITVHLGYVAGDFHTLLDGDLYLPKESWGENRQRCREAGIPEDVVYKPKWEIALDLLKRSLDEGVSMRWLTADEDYGRVRRFRETVNEAELTYVVEVPCSLSGWTQIPQVQPIGTVVDSGRTLTKERIAPGARQARQLKKLWKRGGPSWQKYRIKDTDKGPVVWEVQESPFYPRDDGIPGRQERLIVARQVLTGEVKYFLSNANADVALKILLYVAFSRSHIERLFEDAKGEVGFDHFEVRTYRSLVRHLTLTTVSLYFLCEQTERLRGEKYTVDTLPDPRGRGAAIGFVVAPGGDHSPATESSAQDRVLAAKGTASCPMPHQSASPTATTSWHRSEKGAPLPIENLAL